MPVLEAFTDETQVMRYKLFTASKDLPRLSTITNVRGPIVLELNTTGEVVIPNTDPSDADDSYDFLLLNKDVATMVSGTNVGSFRRDGRSQVIRGVKEVSLTAVDRSGETNPIIKTVLFITSRNSGATTSVVIQNNSTGQFPA